MKNKLPDDLKSLPIGVYAEKDFIRIGQTCSAQKFISYDDCKSYRYSLRLLAINLGQQVLREIIGECERRLASLQDEEDVLLKKGGRDGELLGNQANKRS